MASILEQLQAWDNEAFLAINRWFQRLNDIPQVSPFLDMVNGLGNPYTVLLIGGSVACLVPRLPVAFGRFGELTIIALLVIGVTRVKVLIGRYRPQFELAGAFERGDAVALFGERGVLNSMPSGHTTLAFALAAMFYAWTCRSERLQHRRRFIALHVFPLAALVGLCRIGGGMHYLSDVIVGAGLGLLCGWAATRPAALILRRRAARGQASDPGPESVAG